MNNAASIDHHNTYVELKDIIIDEGEVKNENENENERKNKNENENQSKFSANPCLNHIPSFKEFQRSSSSSLKVNSSLGLVPQDEFPAMAERLKLKKEELKAKLQKMGWQYKKPDDLEDDKLIQEFISCVNAFEPTCKTLKLKPLSKDLSSRFHQLKELHLINFDQPLPDLSRLKLTHIYFYGKFNQPLHRIRDDGCLVKLLPEGLTHLSFTKIVRDKNGKKHLSDFNQLLHAAYLPSSLTHLTLGSSFNQTVDSLPSDLTYLKFGQAFRKPVDCLPRNLKRLEFSLYFNQPVDHLPSGLEYLALGGFFNKSINHLPVSLTHLILSDLGKEPIDGGSFPNLTHLTFGMQFNQSVDAYKWPPHLTHLTFAQCFEEPVRFLPATLTHLTFGKFFNHPVNDLPEGITDLCFGSDFNQPIDLLPSALKRLKIGSKDDYCYFNQTLNYLPDGLTHLEIYGVFNHPFVRLPTQLTHLTINNNRYASKPYTHAIPKSSLLQTVQLMCGNTFYRPSFRICE